MLRNPRPAARTAMLLSTVALLVAGCGGGAVKASEVEEKAEQALGAQVGTTPNISCPDDLEAEKGATVRCELTVDGDDTAYGVTVTAASVDGSTVNMDFKVDETPLD
ncbi:DUF4333 domain-containing protein [Mumia sp. DW29H23]|uniref:DUF4333 domain-containing protein n=1 Tax=Mumia sp. DW29H23 TaxID=3421241 RepID=UPI003D698802